MGGFSIWHGLVLLVLLAIPVGIGLLVWLIVRLSQKRSAEKARIQPHDGTKP
ncbi:hypothetical protein [Stenotrophomonas tumulicola]|uniref:Transmembrane protein n=1 Tax=Stenotrophomonas tumulicola TaxID=1685415 RepID=A0A7W3FL06_9GAMM|nr:hypothetical protein [Stenotrophomonas tumulicola]MBA8681475.1 hypothetical protein [Stenotrophomonas tumulicola]